jgi:hypothetical protein
MTSKNEIVDRRVTEGPRESNKVKEAQKGRQVNTGGGQMVQTEPGRGTFHYLIS